VHPTYEPNVDDSISIHLTRGQVTHVLRQAKQEAGVAAALSGLADRDKLAETYRSLDGYPQLSRSLLIGLIVLRCFPEDGTSVGVNEVADTLGLGASNSFRYITTLVAAGLLERDPRTRRYHRPTAQ
jgi:hypothetical protein